MSSHTAYKPLISARGFIYQDYCCRSFFPDVTFDKDAEYRNEDEEFE